jgi:hypothetical protein
MTTKTEKTYWARIYLSGPIDVIRQTCRQECIEAGLCVTVDETLFIYTGGEEFGAVVGLINYPRFPCSESALFERAEKLALRLLESTFQHSVLIMATNKTEWITKRET